MSSGRVCVRLLFLLRSVASCVAFVLCWFVWRSCAVADCGRRSVHIRTGDRSAPRRTRYGRDRDRLGTAHGLCTDVRRTGNGHQSSGGRAGIRLMPTFCDIPRWVAARRTGYPRTIHGRATGYIRTGNRLAAR